MLSVVKNRRSAERKKENIPLPIDHSAQHDEGHSFILLRRLPDEIFSLLICEGAARRIAGMARRCVIRIAAGHVIRFQEGISFPGLGDLGVAGRRRRRSA